MRKKKRGMGLLGGGGEGLSVKGNRVRPPKTGAECRQSYFTRRELEDEAPRTGITQAEFTGIHFRRSAEMAIFMG